ncbi:glycerol transporter [Steccherinum ochraceum]|uniref:Glycerol transporter n=1 Tax=Steccherinum ochraceum TaxID=92696 RepID=A0A4R0R888_9APHY|nr:glycerol transporter [Steccherinum ochraceum]
MVIISINYAIAKCTGHSQFAPIATWVFNIAVLFANDWFSGYHYSALHPALKFMDDLSGLHPRWYINFNISMLRLIAFNMDYYWAYRRTGTQDRGADLNYKERTSTYHPTEMYNYWNYVAFVLYPPLYLAGPIMSFNDFLWQLRRPTHIPLRGVLNYLFRFVVCILTLEFVLHFMYVIAIKDRQAWQGDSAADIGFIGFWNLVIIWLKLLVPWRFFRLWALADGIDPPENMIRCVANNYSVFGFWRSWHRSYNLWIVRYIYVPLGGTQNVLFTTILIFTFVALWHDLSFKLLAWGWLISLFFIPELSARYLLPQSKYGDKWWYRHVCAIGAVGNMLMLVSANLVGFAVGTEGMSFMLSRMFSDWDGIRFIPILYETLYKTMADIHALDIKGDIVIPSSPGFEQAIARKSGTSVLRAGYVITPATVADIPPAIEFALSRLPPLEIAVKGGGCHSSTNSSTQGGLVIDLSKLKAVEVKDDKEWGKVVAVQGGCIWRDVYEKLKPLDLIVVGGNVSFVGVGGFTTGGGYSSLSAELGLAIDNLVEAEVVLADGSVVRCSEKQEPDLFWAIRGGGNQFGIVTEFVFKAHPARGPAITGTLVYPATDQQGQLAPAALDNVLKALHEFLPTQGTNSWLNLVFGRAPTSPYLPAVMIFPYIDGKDGTTALAEKALKPLLDAMPPYIPAQLETKATFYDVSRAPEVFLDHAPPRYAVGAASFGDLNDMIVREVFNEWVKYSDQEETRGTMVMFEFGKKGKIDSVAPTATAFPLREPHYYSVITARHGRHTNPEHDRSARDWVSSVCGIIKKHNQEKLCTPANFALGPEYESQEEVYGVNLTRLRKLKAKYDPKKVWRRGWIIEPEA